MGNSVDPDQTPYSAASDLDLHCLFRSVCTNTSGYYCIAVKGACVSSNYAKYSETDPAKLVLEFQQINFTTYCVSKSPDGGVAV